MHQQPIVRKDGKDEGAVLTPGTVVFQKYEVVRRIGAGGMGTVYEVKDIARDRRLALKVLEGRITDDEAALRFQSEGRNAACLQHPAIAGVYEFGVDDSGIPFIAVEYVDGVLLEDFVSQRKCLNFEQFCSIFFDVCEALDTAHRSGIVHRDIKPQNIFVLSDGEGRVSAKLSDFGISKRSGDGLTLTQAGIVLGTPAYMSPEQAVGDPATEGSDLYSMGCVMYRCLAGRPPFLGETIYDTMVMHRDTPPPPLKRNAKSEAIPERLSDLIMRLLVKTADKRFTSATEVKAELVDIFGPPLRHKKSSKQQDSGDQGQKWLQASEEKKVKGSGDPKPNVRLARQMDIMNDSADARPDVKLARKRGPRKVEGKLPIPKSTILMIGLGFVLAVVLVVARIFFTGL